MITAAWTPAHRMTALISRELLFALFFNECKLIRLQANICGCTGLTGNVLYFT